MREKILEIIKNKPKHYAVIIKKDPVLLEWVMSNSIIKTQKIAEHIYSAIHQKSNICQNENVKRFVSITDGFAFCGMTATCQCAKLHVSQQVSLTKQNLSIERKTQSNKKRENTSLALYGVKNNGQTKLAKDNHKQLYNDKVQVDKITEKIKQTKLVAHGSTAFNNRPKANTTFAEKYNVSGPHQLSARYLNPKLDWLRDEEKLKTLFPVQSVKEIAKELECADTTVYTYLSKYKLRDTYKSTYEKEIIYYLETLGITNIVTNTRKLIKKEIDIYLPDFNLAIEFNGIYWHHDKIPHINKHYHYTKFKECEEKNIELLTIFSDSWEKNKDIWKKKIRYKLKKSERKVYARKTIVKIIPTSQTKDFLNTHHIQGYCSSEICLGLFLDEEMVSLMTFSKKRIIFGKAPESDIELVRFATSDQVVGAASKLLKYFIRNYNPTNIITYSDNQYSMGNLYKALGFTCIRETKAGYKYHDPKTKKSFHRYNFTKHKLVNLGYDASLTEKEIMDNLGYLRVWDCGSKTWKLHI